MFTLEVDWKHSQNSTFPVFIQILLNFGFKHPKENWGEKWLPHVSNKAISSDANNDRQSGYRIDVHWLK